MITNYIIFWWELTHILLHYFKALSTYSISFRSSLKVLWLISVGIIKFYGYFHTFPHELKLKSRNSFSEVFHTLNSYQQLHKGLYFTKFKSFRYSISLNRHPGVNYFKFWLKGGALSRRKSLNQLCCFVRNYRLYWFGFSWSLKGFKLIGNRIRFFFIQDSKREEEGDYLMGEGGAGLISEHGVPLL